MANLRKRIEILEYKADPQEVIIHVYHESPDGLLRRTDGSGEVIETLTRQEFEALPGRKIYVRSENENDTSED